MILDNEEPLVDILLPTFNRERFLRDSINSIINQTYKNWRLLIYDDGSTDNTYYLVGDYCDKYPNIFYIQSKENKGVGHGRNTLLKQASAEFCMWQDSDDISDPERLQIMLNYIRTTGKDMCFSYLTPFKDGQNPYKRETVRPIDTTKYTNEDGLYDNINFPTGIFRTKLKQFKFREDIKKAEDWYWLLDMIKSRKVSFGHIPLPLYYLRLHDGRLTFQKD